MDAARRVYTENIRAWRLVVQMIIAEKATLFATQKQTHKPSADLRQEVQSVYIDSSVNNGGHVPDYLQ